MLQMSHRDKLKLERFRHWLVTDSLTKGIPYNPGSVFERFYSTKLSFPVQLPQTKLSVHHSAQSQLSLVLKRNEKLFRQIRGLILLLHQSKCFWIIGLSLTQKLVINVSPLNNRKMLEFQSSVQWQLKNAPTKGISHISG